MGGPGSGRKKGSKNKGGSKGKVSTFAKNFGAKSRGRPAGVKNKPKAKKVSSLTSTFRPASTLGK